MYKNLRIIASPARFSVDSEKLGESSFGHYRASALDRGDIEGQDRANVALKCVVLLEDDASEEHQVASELYVLELLRSQPHPNILQFYKAFLEREWKEGNSLVVMLFSSCLCSLWDMARKAAALPQGCLELWLQELLLALNFLHDKHILHRDIQPRNILMTPNISTGCLCIRVSDFGAAIQIQVHADECAFHDLSIRDERTVKAIEPLVQS
jgi:serine/threonine protein kinase